MSNKTLKRAPLLCLGAFLLYSLLLVPAFEYVGSDIALASTLLFDAVDILMQWAEFLGAALVMGTLVTAVYTDASANRIRPLITKLTVFLLLKYLLSVITLSIVHGSFFDTTLDFGGYALSFFIEAAIFGTVFYLTLRYTKKREEAEDEKRRALLALSKEYVPEASALPLPAPVALRHALVRILFLGMGIYTAVRAVAYILNEVAFILMGFSFTLADLPVTLLYFLLMVLLPGLLSYLLAYKFTNLLSKSK